MSMLAERKRKVKWSLNPRGKDWSDDSSKFGQKLLEKMGWTAGKGLGAKENGITEHIKVSYKNDSKGMGFKDTDDQWTEHDSNFNELLNNLSENIAANETKENRNVRSLEELSQSSRARVHYHKFTRGKDLSRYSEKDLANIFGKRRVLNAIKEVEEVIVDTNCGDVKTLNRGSMVDYFQSKMLKKTTSNEGKNDVMDLRLLEDKSTVMAPRLLEENRSGSKVMGSRLLEVNRSESEVTASSLLVNKSDVIVPSLLRDKSEVIDSDLGDINDGTSSKRGKKRKLKLEELSKFLGMNLTKEDAKNGENNKRVKNGGKKTRKEAGVCNQAFDFFLNQDEDLSRPRMDEDTAMFEVKREGESNKINQRNGYTNQAFNVNSREERENLNAETNEIIETTDVNDFSREIRRKKSIKARIIREIEKDLDKLTPKSNKKKKSNLNDAEEYTISVKRRRKNEDNFVNSVAKSDNQGEKKTLGIENPGFNAFFDSKENNSVVEENNTSDTISTGNVDFVLPKLDLILNAVSIPVKEKKDVRTKPARKNVRFHLEKESSESPKRLKNNFAIENPGFDEIGTRVDEKTASFSNALDAYEAEVENDMNESKLSKSIVVGESGDAEDEETEEGTRLAYKNANFGPTPWFSRKPEHARSSYKHLIRGNIVVRFRDTNLSSIEGYPIRGT